MRLKVRSNKNIRKVRMMRWKTEKFLNKNKNREMRTKNSFNDENVRITSVKPRYYIYKERELFDKIEINKIELK